MNNHTIAIIGGSGLYQIEGISIKNEHTIDTPFGSPSDQIIEGELNGSRVLFLPRHGKKHTILPSEINFRANIYALKELGAVWCISVTAVGSLAEKLKPGDLVVPNQVIDKTFKRAGTFFGDGIVAHVSLADPFCPVLSKMLYEAAKKVGAQQFNVHRGGTYICMEGPAFSTRAEAKLHCSWGADAINMTIMPEAKLAREAEIAYANLGLVTDYDCWREEDSTVGVEEVVAVMKRNSGNAKEVIKNCINSLNGMQPSELASKALRTAIMTNLQDVPEKTKLKLKAILPR